MSLAKKTLNNKCLIKKTKNQFFKNVGVLALVLMGLNIANAASKYAYLSESTYEVWSSFPVRMVPVSGTKDLVVVESLPSPMYCSIDDCPSNKNYSITINLEYMGCSPKLAIGSAELYKRSGKWFMNVPAVVTVDKNIMCTAIFAKPEQNQIKFIFNEGDIDFSADNLTVKIK